MNKIFVPHELKTIEVDTEKKSSASTERISDVNVQVS